MVIRWAWQFRKNLCEAYVWHRSAGEKRALRALASAWRTALVLMADPVMLARSPMGATLAVLARKPRAEVGDTEHRRNFSYDTVFAFPLRGLLSAMRATGRFSRRLAPGRLRRSEDSTPSDGFTWKPDPVSRRQSVRVAVGFAFAWMSVAACSLYPLKLVISTFERAIPTRIAESRTFPTQQAGAVYFSKARENIQLATAKLVGASYLPSAKGDHPMRLNPGSTVAITPHKPAASTPYRRLGVGMSKPKRQHTTPNLQSGERRVLVVVRRRGPPYNTKILRARIRDGRLIVDLRARRGLSLY